MYTYHFLFAGLLGFLMGALAVGYGQQHQNEVRDRVYDAQLLSNVRHEWRNDRNEHDLARREVEIVFREQRLAVAEARLADANNLTRTQVLDLLPELLETFEQLDTQGLHRGKIEELRDQLRLLEMRQRTEPSL